VLDDENRYRIAKLTRSVQRAIDAVPDPADTKDADEAISRTIAVLDLYLVAETGSPPAGEFLAEAWQEDRVSVEQLAALMEYVQQEPPAAEVSV
jgi:hypothetical protein